MSRQPSASLRQGRRDLEGIAGLVFLEDLVWFDVVEKWALRVRLTRDGPESRFVARETEWYVIIDDCYPWETLKFFPAKADSITATFHHQLFNRPGSDDRPWRTGELCLDTTIKALGRHGLEDEPFEVSGPRGRLRWHAYRALEWLKCAASGELIKRGDPFETPHFPGANLAEITVVYSEDQASFEVWGASSITFGVVHLVPLAANPAIRAVTGFYALPGQLVLTQKWGSGALATTPFTRGVWFRLPKPLALEPWQAPTIWDELCQVCRANSVNLDQILKRLFRGIRDGQKHILLVGFPIPENEGEADACMHWQPISLPVLTQEITVKGFRTGHESTRYIFDRSKALAKTAELKWCNSENWCQSQLVSRGRVSTNLANSHILLVGGGALGSVLAELLVRAGLRRLTIVDNEMLQVGNLCRHTLTLGDVKSAKAKSLSLRLRSINPHTEVDFLFDDFPPLDESSVVPGQCDLVIDCTADDAVIYHLGQFPWGGEKRFVSLSLGHEGRRLFSFFAQAASFPEDAFRNALSSWLQKDRDEFAGSELPKEGIGCWHPVFPARVDDVWLMATIAVKHLDDTLKSGTSATSLTVFEQQFSGSNFQGVIQVSCEAADG